MSETQKGWGSVPALSLSAATGLGLVAGADALSRSGGSYAQPLFWLGLLVIVAPSGYRLASDDVPRGERIALAALFGLTLYAVKVLHDPFGFTFADELVHRHNVDEIVRTGRLFGGNSILPVTPLYPGLETVTAAVVSTTGLSTFAAGLVVIGAARLMLTVALFRVVEAVTGSSRAGGLAAVLYALAPSYLFFSAQFSYESLALPMAVVLALALARSRQHAGTGDGRAWSTVVLVLMTAIVVTHHLTSYAVVGFLVAMSVLHTVLPGGKAWLAPWRLTAAAAALTVLWLVFVADRTVGYLTPVISRAIGQTFDTLGGEAATRTIFQRSSDQASVTPAWEQVVAIAAVLVIAAWLPFGLRAVWKEFRRHPPVMLLALASIAYLGTMALRLVPAANETAARASEFLGFGVAVVLALAGLQRWRPRRASWAGPGAVCAAAALLVVGGFIAGWPTGLRLAQPYRIAVGDGTIEPQGVGAAQWMRAALGAGNRIAAEQADARLFQAYGREVAIAGTNPPVELLLHSPTVEPWQPGFIRKQRYRYAAVNRRKVSADVLAGYFFARPDGGGVELRSSGAVHKFDRGRAADRLFDSGDIVIYDIERVGSGRPAR